MDTSYIVMSWVKSCFMIVITFLKLKLAEGYQILIPLIRENHQLEHLLVMYYGVMYVICMRMKIDLYFHCYILLEKFINRIYVDFMKKDQLFTEKLKNMVSLYLIKKNLIS